MPTWCVAPLEMNEGNSLGQGYNQPTGCSTEKAPHVTFNFFFTHYDCFPQEHTGTDSIQNLLENVQQK